MNRLRTLLLLSLTAALPFSTAAAQSKSPELDHDTIHVRDLEKSTAFYEKVIGLEKIAEPFKDGRHVWFRMSPHQQLHVVAGATEPSSADIEVHFAFRVGSLPDFMARLDQMQVKYRNFKGDGKVGSRPDGVHQCYLQDPDGYWIEINDDKF